MIQLRNEPEPADPSAEARFEQLQEVDDLRAAVAHMPRPMRFVVVEHYWGGRSLEDIAGELGAPQARATELLTLGREWLRCEMIARELVESADVFGLAALT